VWQLRSKRLMLGERTRVMGVVNVTPDSFSDGGLYLDPERAVEHAMQLLEDGADLLDLGAESTRPGSGAGVRTQAAVSADEEQARLLPVVEALKKSRPEAIISVDTYKARTARAALAAGAEIVNDVSGLSWDDAMASTCAEFHCGLVLMHTRGRPADWKTQPALPRGSVMPLVLDGLAASLGKAREAGIPAQCLVLDPGYGFGKRFGENFDLLAVQHELLALGYPLLAGLSRKSFLSPALTAGKTSESALLRSGPTEDLREIASVAAMVAAILKGASIVRVHQVRHAVAASAIADAVLAEEHASE